MSNNEGNEIHEASFDDSNLSSRQSQETSSSLPNASDSSNTGSGSARGRRIVELLQGDERGDISSRFYISPEFFNEDVAWGPNEDDRSSWAVNAEDIDIFNIIDEEIEPIEDLETDYDSVSDGENHGIDDEDLDSVVIISDQSDMETGDEGEEVNNYDTSLPVSHSYLGDNLEESRGRCIFIEGSEATLQVFNISDIVLFPGQTLPLSPSTSNPGILMSLKQCLSRGDKTIGILAQPLVNKIGTTADIRTYHFDDRDPGDYRAKILLEGRQRFRLKSNQFSLTASSVVEILPEISLGSPYPQGTTLQRFYRIDTPSEFIISRHPYWLLRQYDAKSIIVRILEEIKYWIVLSGHEEKVDSIDFGESNSSPDDSASECSNKPRRGSPLSEIKVSNVRIEQSTKDPTYFSYWLASNLSISNRERLQALTMNCDEQRLKWLYDILRRGDQFGCVGCKNILCYKKHVFQMSRSGVQVSYVNEYGVIHDTLTVKSVRGLTSGSNWCREFSWFPGYEWMIMHCGSCTRHIGWCYRRITDNIKPRRFYGLSRQNIELIIPEGKKN